MNEPPGSRMRVGLTGLTMAEYFRDEGGKMCCYSSTTSSVSVRLVLRYLRCLDVCRQP